MILGKFINAAFLIMFLTQCNSFKGSKSSQEQEDAFEGEITFTNKLITNRVLSKNDSMVYNKAKTMYIYRNCLIDVRENSIIEDGVFVRKDTTSYFFYNFDKQKYIEIKRLTGDLEILKQGPMAEIKDFSRDGKYDPLNGIPDSAFVIKDTVLNGANVKTVKFFSDPTVDDSMTLKFTEIIKYWVNPAIKGFPVQISYSLSKSKDNAFVFRREYPLPSGESYISTILDYKPKKLSDSLVSVFKRLMEK